MVSGPEFGRALRLLRADQLEASKGNKPENEAAYRTQRQRRYKSCQQRRCDQSGCEHYGYTSNDHARQYSHSNTWLDKAPKNVSGWQPKNESWRNSIAQPEKSSEAHGVADGASGRREQSNENSRHAASQG